MRTSTLLAEHAEILNEHGPDSVQETAFLEIHRDNDELISLCSVARSLKKAMLSREGKTAIEWETKAVSLHCATNYPSLCADIDEQSDGWEPFSVYYQGSDHFLVFYKRRKQ